jgi:hypothetical protein
LFAQALRRKVYARPQLTGQLAQVQPEPQLHEPEVEHPQSPAMMMMCDGFDVPDVWKKLFDDCSDKCVDVVLAKGSSAGLWDEDRGPF